MAKVLVAFYSYSGSTRALAEVIAARTSGELLELLPEQPYSFDYNTASKEARAQVARGYCPPLRGGVPAGGYDVIFVGSPNWFGDIAPPVLSFLRGFSTQGSTVVPFCTHGGGGFGGIVGSIARECPGAALPAGYAGGYPLDEGQVAEWLEGLGLCI